MGLNTLFGLLGLTLLGIGGYVMIEVKKYSGVTEGSYDGIPIFIICLGLFVFLIAFFGCFGAMKKSSCLTMTYSVVLLILVICQIGAGIAGFVLKSDLFNALEKELKKTMPVSYIQNYILLTSLGLEMEPNKRCRWKHCAIS